MATVSDCANHLFISERRFREILDQGIVDRQPAGSYDLDVVREQYITHLREVAAGRSSSADGLDLTKERARLASEQADAQEMKNAASRGELLARGDVHAAVTEAFARVRAKLLALPSKIAPVAYGLPTIAEVRDKITDGVSEALSELSATRIAGVPASELAEGGAGRGSGLVGRVRAAAEPDGEPVG